MAFLKLDDLPSLLRIPVTDGSGTLYYPVVSEDGVLGTREEWQPFVLLEQRGKAAGPLLAACIKHHPDWAKATCPPLAGDAVLLEVLLDGFLHPLSDEDLQRVVQHIPDETLSGSLADCLQRGLLGTAEHLWSRGMRFRTPPSPDLVYDALLVRFSEWVSRLERGMGSKKPDQNPLFSSKAGKAWRKQCGLLPEAASFGRTFLELASRWLPRLTEAGLDWNAPLGLTLKNDVHSWTALIPFLLYALQNENLSWFSEQEREEWFDLWLNTAHQNGLQWQNPVQNWRAPESLQTWLEVLTGRATERQAMQVGEWALSQGLDAPRKTANRPRF